MTKDDCVPVHVALQLMDYSSLGRGNDYQDFQRTNRHLQKALKAIVNGQILPLATINPCVAEISQNTIKASIAP